MSTVLRSKLSAVQHKSVGVNACAGGLTAIAATIVLLSIGMMADWLFELSFTVRAAVLAIDLSIVITLVVHEVIWPVLHQPHEDDLALRVERHWPALGNKLIAAIQLSRADAIPAGASVSLVQALIQQTEALTAPIDFRDVVKTDKLVRVGVLTGLIFLVGTTGLALGGSDGMDLLKRALLVPGVEVPRHTRVHMITPDPLVVARGESIELRAQASGIIPSDGSVVIRYVNSHQPVQMAMTADANHAKQFALTLDSVADSFTYRVTLNDGHSADIRVKASVRPSAAAIDIQQLFPPYTHLPPVKRFPGDLRLLAGSRLALGITANRPVKKTDALASPFNRVTFICKSGSVDFPLISDVADPLLLTAQDPTAGTRDVPVPADAQGLSIHLVDDDGLETRDPAVYPIEVIPDQPPTVRVTRPDQKEQLSTLRAKLIVGVDALDDFALGNVSLHYKTLKPTSSDAAADVSVPPSASASAPEQVIPFELNGTPRQFRGQFDFQLDQLKDPPLLHGAIEWWLVAEDTNTVTGPGKATSEHYLTRIGTEAEVRSDLFNRLGNPMSQIKDTEDYQKQVNEGLGELIQQKVKN